MSGLLLLSTHITDTGSFSAAVETYSIPHIPDSGTKVRAKLKDHFLLLWTDKFQRLLKISGAELQCETPDAHMTFPFSIRLTDGEKYNLSALTDDQKQQWFSALEQAAKDRFIYKYLDGHMIPTTTPGLLKEPILLQIQSKLIGSTESVSFMFSHETLCNDWMADSKLSILLPLELLELYRKDYTDLLIALDCLETENWNNNRTKIIRKIQKHLQRLQDAIMFLTGKSEKGPFFRPSVHRSKKEYGFCPINLHIQRLSILRDESNEVWNVSEFLTSGAYSAIPLGFSHGFLSVRMKLLKAFKLPETEENFSFIKTEVRQFWEARSFFVNADKVWRTIRDNIIRAIRSENIADAKKAAVELIQFMDRTDTLGGSEKDKRTILVEKYSQEAENMATEYTEARRKLEVEAKKIIDTPDQRRPRVKLFKFLNAPEKWIKWIQVDKSKGFPNLVELKEMEALFSSFDEYIRLSSNALLMHLLRYMDHSTKIPKLFSHLESRSEMVFSQSLATVCTGIMAKFWLLNAKNTKIFEKDKVDRWEEHNLIITIISHLSCARDEVHMIQDSAESWYMIENYCTFHFLRESQTVASIPTINGHRTGLKIGIPIPGFFYNALFGDSVYNGTFTVYPIFWNVGINASALDAFFTFYTQLRNNNKSQSFGTTQTEIGIQIPFDPRNKFKRSSN